MNPLQKIKLTKELLGLAASLKAGQLKPLEKIKATKRVLEIVALLGGNDNSVVNDYNQLLQDIIDGKINVYQARDQLDELQKIFDASGGDAMPEGDTKKLFVEAIKAAAVQVLEGQGYKVAA